MNAQFQISPLDQQIADLLIQRFKAVDPSFTSYYLNGIRKVDKWDEHTTGIVIEKDGKRVFQSLKTRANIRLGPVDVKNRDTLLKILYDSRIVEKPDFTLGTLLALLYTALMVFIIMPAMFDRSQEFALLGTGALVFLCAGFVALSLVKFSIYKSPTQKMAYILFFIGAVGFAPSSLLLFPLFSAFLRSKLPEYFKAKTS